MKNILALFLATIALFVWNAVSWMALPFHENSLKSIPDGALSDNISNVMMESGVYHYPGMPGEGRTESEVLNLLKEGPRVTLMVYQAGSSDLFNPMDFLMSFLLNFVICGVLFLLIIRLNVKSMGEVIKWSLILGLLVSLSSDFALMNWFKFSSIYTLANSMDHLIGFVVAGLVIWMVLKKELVAE
ncbi:MAG: DUF1761 domain-containing protein [Cyclobacteriaceae bacterium]